MPLPQNRVDADANTKCDTDRAPRTAHRRPRQVWPLPERPRRLVEQREAEHRGKLKALRAAARVGIGALDRGEFTEFVAIEDLQAYLNDLSDKVISKIVKWALWPSEDGSFVSPRPQNSSSRIS
jgi:hypothetical protein